MSLIGSRLETVLNIIKENAPFKNFADIGSDHAFLAIEVKERGYAENVIASDINPLPLEKGRINAAKKGVGCDFILSDGFDALEDKNIGCAAICGMGGELIADMIQRSGTAKKCFLVIQAMSSQEILRAFLWDNGFKTGETFVKEKGKFYSVTWARYTGEKTEYTYTDTFLGKERPHTAEFTGYAEKILKSAKKRLYGEKATGKDSRNTEELIKECQIQVTSFLGGQ